MKKLFLLLFFIIPFYAFSQRAILKERGIVWNTETRTLEFSIPGSTSWLVGGTAQIKFSSGPVVSTSDKRFDITVAKHHSKWFISGNDREKDHRLGNGDHIS